MTIGAKEMAMFAAIKNNPKYSRSELSWVANNTLFHPDADTRFEQERSMWLTVIDRLVMLGHVRQYALGRYRVTSEGIDAFTLTVDENLSLAMRLNNAIKYGTNY